MTRISNEGEFRQAIKGLDIGRQRLLAARFADNVDDLCHDKRIAYAVRIAAAPKASNDELDVAFHEARAAAIDCRCGAEGEKQYRILSDFIGN